MASTENNLNELSVLKALQIEGYSLSEARNIVELSKKVADLEPKQLLLRARDLTENHVGMVIEFSGQSGVLNDIETPRPGFGVSNLKTAYHSQANTFEVGYEDDGTGVMSPVSRTPRITAVIGTKLVRIPSGMMVKLTETRDL